MWWASTCLLTNPRHPDLVIQNDGAQHPCRPWWNRSSGSAVSTASWKTRSITGPIGTSYYQNKHLPHRAIPFCPVCGHAGRHRNRPWWIWAAAMDGTPFILPGSGPATDGASTFRILPFSRFGNSSPFNPCCPLSAATFVQQPASTMAGTATTMRTAGLPSIPSTSSKNALLLLARCIKRAQARAAKFFIEVRSIHDPLFGKGDSSRSATPIFYNNHYRRFIVHGRTQRQNCKNTGFRDRIRPGADRFCPLWQRRSRRSSAL